MDAQRIGHQITSLQQLSEAAFLKRSVVSPRSPWMGHRQHPAAFLINMAGFMILRMINSGLYIYEKPTEKESK